MQFPQSNITQIIESEREMLLAAKERYGKHYAHALICSVFLSTCVSSVDHDRMMFARFLSIMKKHHTLALFSTLRLHKVQAMMNLRQVLEAGTSAAFAIANPAHHHFVTADERGILDPSKGLAKKRHNWFDKHDPVKSRWIKLTKERINIAVAHANVLSSDSVFRIADAGGQISTPFFDIEDEYFVKTDLWLISSVALSLADLFYGANQSLNVIEFRADFPTTLERLAQESSSLLAEMRETDRFKRAIEKYGSTGTI